jgi:hypothetical protein
MLPGMAGRSMVNQAVQKSLPNNLKGGAFDYPKLTSDFVYPMVVGGALASVDGKKTMLPSLNASIDRNNQEALLAQTLADHNNAVQGGYENTLAQWWPGEDSKPRKTVHPSSSAVEGIRINKDGSIQVKWINGKDKWYTYRGGRDARESSEIAMQLLTAPSIGRALVRKGKLAHKDSRDLTGKPVADPNVGFWGRKYFDPRVGM